MNVDWNDRHDAPGLLVGVTLSWVVNPRNPGSMRQLGACAGAHRFIMTECTHPDPETRKFVDDDLELYVWYDHDEIVGFQLCYDMTGSARAFIWTRSNGFEHAALVRDEPYAITIPGGIPDVQRASSEMNASARVLDLPIAHFVLTTLNEY